MTSIDQTEFTLRPISADEASALRAGGGEVYVADEAPGYPCRQCLRDAEVGEGRAPAERSPSLAGGLEPSPHVDVAEVLDHPVGVGR